MTSAYASPPHPFSFGSADLKANARKFLERALVISVVFHLAAVGAFRAVERRAAVREEVELRPPVWKRPTEFIRVVPTPPGAWSPPNTNKSGTLEIVDKTPPVVGFDPRKFQPVDAEPTKMPGTWPGPADPRDPPPQDDPAFMVVVDMPPSPTFAPKPAYPEWAREAGVEGNVLVRVLVGKDGVPKSVILMRGTTGLTEAAVSAAWRWRFNAALSNKKPVEVWVEIPFAFRL